MDELKGAVSDYIRAFETLEPAEIVPFYSVPCMFLAPGHVAAVTDHDSVDRLVALLVEQARNQGYARTEIVGMKTEPLAEDLGSVKGVYVRFDTEGEEIASLGFSYIMRKIGKAWKIAVAVIHEV